MPVTLCDHQNCRRVEGHKGKHHSTPKEAWSFFNDKDSNKIDKAGYATPRGGSKGAYQNHVYRNGQVIIPFERAGDVSIGEFSDGYVVRLYPEQAFSGRHVLKNGLSIGGQPVLVGENAFVLYRTWDSWANLPPLEEWSARHLWKQKEGEDKEVVRRRSKLAKDGGHYVLRLSKEGAGRFKREEGPAQGIFAPEYADSVTNYLCQCVLAWQTVHTLDSPYVTTQAQHLEAIIQTLNFDLSEHARREGMVAHGLTKCPLCMRFLRYDEYHDTISFSEESGLGNAAEQVEGATRSTAANLFHLRPLSYDHLLHTPDNVAWGHAICNTRLGQQRCYSIPELQEGGLKVGVVREERTETFGFMSQNWEMIRSPMGAVWSQLHGDVAENDPPEPSQADTQDSVEALEVPIVEDDSAA